MIISDILPRIQKSYLAQIQYIRAGYLCYIINMDTETLIPLGTIVVIAAGVLLAAMWSRIVGNSPSRSRRAREMNKLASKLSLNYVADTNTLSERLWKPDRKYNLILGEHNGEQVEVYDYQTTTKHHFAPYGQDSLRGTFVGGSKYKYLSVSQIESIVLGTYKKNLEGLKKDSKYGFFTYAFIIILIFSIFIMLNS